MLAHAILAAGRGTRLYGPGGGNKAMTEVRGGTFLIDYVVREMEPLEPAVTHVLVPDADSSIGAHLRTLTRSHITALRSPSDGTGPGIRRLLATVHHEAIAVTTCDLLAPPGSLTSFFTKALELVGCESPRCVVATSEWDRSDLAPIFVHSRAGVITSYGKDVASSSRVFAGARVMNARFQSAILEGPGNHGTDTQMMSALIASRPGTVHEIEVPGLFDVDDPRALERARDFTRAGFSGPSPIR